MSDFEKEYDFQSMKGRNTTSYDDFERLDGYPIHEQPEAEERESTAAATASLEDDDFMQSILKSTASSGLHSTDRPLVTPVGESPIGISPMPVPEPTEINLTPDPEEKLEPFINITGHVPIEKIPDSLESDSGSYMRQAVEERKYFDLEPDQGDFNSPNQTVPSAPEPSLFEPAYNYHVDDKLITESQTADLLNFDSVSETTTKNTLSSEEKIIETTTEITTEVYEKEKLEETTTKEEVVEDCPFIAVCPPKMEESTSPGIPQCTFHPRAWLNPSQLDPRVADLLYWRDLKKSGIVFGSGLVVLLSLTYFSLISVIAYLLLAVMTGTLSYRIYKNVLQAVQKSNDGHPFKEYLDFDLALPREKVCDGAEVLVRHLECTAKELRRLFLVEDLVDSLKFAVMLWCFTYIGAWFNGLTLFILAYITLFTLPKVYETYKVQIDHYVNIISTQVGDIVSKVKAKIPIGKKPKQQ